MGCPAMSMVQSETEQILKYTLSICLYKCQKISKCFLKVLRFCQQWLSISVSMLKTNTLDSAYWKPETNIKIWHV